MFDPIKMKYIYYKKLSFAFKIILVLLFFTQQMYAQEKLFTLSGYIKENSSGKDLAGVKIVEPTNSIEIESNQDGFYSIKLPEGNYELTFKYENYPDKKVRVVLTEDTIKDIVFGEAIVELQEVQLKKNKNDKINQSSIGVEKLNVNTINKLPVLLGEKDIIKSLQLLPGVSSAGEGQSGFNVRGGAIDQNLVLLDDMPLYNTSHLLGFFSTFNSDIIKDVTIYKGNIPANYGGRVSSVVDVQAIEGNNQKISGNGGIGLISSRLTLEIPVVKEKSSLLISGRRSYADAFLPLFEDIKDNVLYFYDLNVKMNYKLTEKDQLFFSSYYGRDVLSLNERFDLDWGNAAFSFRYNRILNDRLFSNTAFIFSKYDYILTIDNNSNPFNITSQINTFQLKEEVQFLPNSKNDWRFGLNMQLHSTNPGDITGKGFVTEYNKSKGLESGLYFSDDWKATDRLKMNYGLRLSNFSALGGRYFILDEKRNIVDSVNVSGIYKNFLNLEPRISMNYKVNSNYSLKLAYARNTQNLQLISNSVTNSPAERWLMTSNNTKPQISDQITLGYVRNSQNKTYEFTVETYYKSLQNQTDYIDGANEFKTEIESQLAEGKGRAYGVEFLIRKNKGKFTGWIGYTLSKTEKQIQGINNGSWYRARQDKTHIVNIVTMYELNKKINFSAIWTYQTGNAANFPIGKYEISTIPYWIFGERNSGRFPAYHRLDVGANFLLKKSEKFSLDMNVSLYNVYGRENAYVIDFRQSETNYYETIAVQTSLFSIVPAVTFNLKF